MHYLAAHPGLSVSILVVLAAFLGYLIYKFNDGWPPSEQRLNEARAQQREACEGPKPSRIKALSAYLVLAILVVLLWWGRNYYFFGDLVAVALSVHCLGSIHTWLLVEERHLPAMAGSPYVSAMAAAGLGGLYYTYAEPGALSLPGLILLIGWFLPARWSAVPVRERAGPSFTPTWRVIFLLVPVIAAVGVLDRKGFEGLWGLHATLHDGLGLLYLWVTSGMVRRVARLVLDHGLHESEFSDLEDSK